jgi:hypothetical protein
MSNSKLSLLPARTISRGHSPRPILRLCTIVALTIQTVVAVVDTAAAQHQGDTYSVDLALSSSEQISMRMQ